MYDPADATSIPEGAVPEDPFYRQMWIEGRCLKHMVEAYGFATAIRSLIGIESTVTAEEIQDVIDASEELSRLQKSCQDYLEGELIRNWAEQGQKGSYVSAAKLLEKMAPDKFGKKGNARNTDFNSVPENFGSKSILARVKKEPEE